MFLSQHFVDLMKKKNHQKQSKIKIVRLPSSEIAPNQSKGLE